MARRVVKVLLCDQCAHDEELETDATRSITVKFGRHPARRVDLCDEHASLWDKLAAIAMSKGTA